MILLALVVLALFVIFIYLILIGVELILILLPIAIIIAIMGMAFKEQRFDPGVLQSSDMPPPFPVNPPYNLPWLKYNSTPEATSSSSSSKFTPTAPPTPTTNGSTKKSGFMVRGYYDGPYGQTAANNYTVQATQSTPLPDYVLNEKGEIVTMKQDPIIAGQADQDEEPAFIDPLTVANIRRQSYKRNDTVRRIPAIPDEYWQDFIIPDAPWNDLRHDIKRHNGEIQL